MSEKRETAYVAVGLYVAIFVALLIVSIMYRRPNPKVTIPLTYPRQDAAR